MELPLKVLKKTSEVNRTNIKLKKSTKQIFVEDFFFLFLFLALLHSFWDLTGPTPGIKSGSLAVNRVLTTGLPGDFPRHLFYCALLIKGT